MKLLRDALGRGWPPKQESILRALLEQKDDGSRAKPRGDAARALERLEEFVKWAEQMYAR